jgi:hypothetical protein
MCTSIYASKKEALTEIFDIENFFCKWSNKTISINKFLEVISKDRYNLKDELKVSADTVSKIITNILPEKPKNNAKVCTYLLVKYGLKPCSSCKQVFLLSDFHSNKNKTYGKSNYCTTCFNDSVRDMRREYQARKRADILQRTPIWADLQKIKEVYKNCPPNYHVDHIIPLQGDLVCGLHVENNLQYLTAIQNIEKSNKFIPA